MTETEEQVRKKISAAFAARTKPKTCQVNGLNLAGSDRTEIEKLQNTDWEKVQPAQVQGYRDGYVFLSLPFRLFLAPRLMMLALVQNRLVIGDNLVAYLCTELITGDIDKVLTLREALREQERFAIEAWADYNLSILPSPIDRVSDEIVSVFSLVKQSVFN